MRIEELFETIDNVDNEINEHLINNSEIEIELLDDSFKPFMESITNTVLSDEFTIFYESVNTGKIANATKQETNYISANSTKKKELIQLLKDKINEKRKEAFEKAEKIKKEMGLEGDFKDLKSNSEFVKKLEKAIKPTGIARIRFIKKGSSKDASSGGGFSEYTIYTPSALDILSFKNKESAKDAVKTKTDNDCLVFKTDTKSTFYATACADKITALYIGPKLNPKESAYYKFINSDHRDETDRLLAYIDAASEAKVKAHNLINKIFDLNLETDIQKYKKYFKDTMFSTRTSAAKEKIEKNIEDDNRREAGISPAAKYDYKITIHGFRDNIAIVKVAIPILRTYIKLNGLDKFISEIKNEEVKKQFEECDNEECLGKLLSKIKAPDIGGMKKFKEFVITELKKLVGKDGTMDPKTKYINIDFKGYAKDLSNK